MQASNNRALSALQYVDNDKFVSTCQSALKKHNGHRRRAAKELEITVRTLLRWCAKYPKILVGVDTYEATEEERAASTRRRLRTIRKKGGRP